MRELFCTWPSLSFRIELAPWHWDMDFYRDVVERRCGHLVLGPLTVEWFANAPAFSGKE